MTDTINNKVNPSYFGYKYSSEMEAWNANKERARNRRNTESGREYDRLYKQKQREEQKQLKQNYAQLIQMYNQQYQLAFYYKTLYEQTINQQSRSPVLEIVQ